jgi:hypothetical protein
MTGSLSDVADELYGADPVGFVARRTELVKAARTAKDRDLATQIGALRRPTVAAWYVNLLARSSSTELDALLELGARMRAAQAELDMATVASLLPERRDRGRAALKRLEQVLAGQGVTPSPAALAEVGGTLTAAVADPAAAAAVRSGCLARSLVYAGFGEVDLSDAVGAELEAWVDRRAAERGAADLDAGAVEPVEDEPAPPHLVLVKDVEPEESEGPEASSDDEEAAAEQAVAAAQKALERVRAKQRLDAATRDLTTATTRHAAAEEEREKAQREVDATGLAYAQAEERLRTAAEAEATAAEALIAATEALQATQELAT